MVEQVVEAVQQTPQPAVRPPTVIPMPVRSREKLSAKERGKRDAEEAEEILDNYFDGSVYTFPTTGVKVPVQFVPEAAYQRMFFQGELPPLPDPHRKEIDGKKGKKISVPDYDNEGYKAALDAYNNHNANIRQQQAGNMMRYIYKRGALIELPEEWVEEYLSELPDDADDPPLSEMKYAYLCDQAYSNAELKALTIAICGRDPLSGDTDEDEKEDE